MSDALSFAEIERQQVELLPARTVLSMCSTGGCGSSVSGQGGGTATSGGTATTTAMSVPGATGGTGGQGGAATGIAGFWHNWIYIEGDMNNTLTGAQGGEAEGGAATTYTSMG